MRSVVEEELIRLLGEPDRSNGYSLRWTVSPSLDVALENRGPVETAHVWIPAKLVRSLPSVEAQRYPPAAKRINSLAKLRNLKVGNDALRFVVRNPRDLDAIRSLPGQLLDAETPRAT